MDAGQAGRAGAPNPQGAERADVLVLGGGTAGLVAANRLAKEGRKVLLLEANHQVGGLTLSIKRKGFTFDAGCSSFESMGLLFPILELLDLPGEEGFHRVHHRTIGPPTEEDPRPGGSFDFRLDSWEQILGSWLMEESVPPANIHRLAKRLQKLEQALAKMHAHPPPFLRPAGERWRGWLDLVRNIGIFPTLLGAAGVDFEALVRRELGDTPLARILGKAGYTRSDLLTVGGFYHAWLRDYWYPKGGTGAWVEALAANLVRLGGEVRVKQRVEQILVEKGRAVGVETHRGQRFYADQLLWTGSAPALYGKLLKDHPGVGGRFARKSLELHPGDPIICAYVGLDLPLERLRERLDDTTHTFYFPDDQVVRVADSLDDPDVHDKVWVQINANNFHEPDQAPEGKSCLTVHAFSDVRWLDRWGLAGKPKGDLSRDRAYKQLKKKVASEMVSTAAAIVPELKDRVEYLDLGSPMSITRFTGNTHGSTTGWAFDPKHGPYGVPFVKSKSGMPGLFTAGQWYMQPGGVPFAAFSGWVTAGRM